MSPRGPLPARVYWTRRLFLLGVLVALVVGVARLLGGGADPGAASARPAPSPTGSPSPTPSGTESAAPAGAAPTTNPSQAAVPPAEPSGPCQDSDVQVAPAVRDPAYAGRRVRFTLELTSLRTPACTWEVSAKSVVLKVTSGDDRIWTTQDCPGAVEHRSVVVRQGRVTRAHVTWKGQRSDSACSNSTPWAEPGYYHAEAAAFGSDPVDEQFHLLPPPRPTITPTPSPSPSGGPHAKN